MEINRIRVIEQAEPRVWQDERVFDAPTGGWAIRFHDWFEFHMGAYVWNVSLSRHGRDVTSKHPLLAKAQRKLRLPGQYRPWCSGRPMMALLTPDLVLYDVVTRESWRWKMPQLPVGLQWSPVGQRLAATFSGKVRVREPGSRKCVDIAVQHPQYEFPEVFWWRDGERLLVVHQTSRRAKPRLSCFHALDGSLVGSVRFDPRELVPYDAASFRRIYRRTGGPLRLASGTRAIGELLDRWNRVEFDETSCRMRAYVYRPTGPCKQTDGRFGCDVREECVEVQISL